MTGLEQTGLVAAGAAASWLVQYFLKRTLGTRYRTQKQCDDCSVRSSMDVIKALVVELAIKAGVPPHEVARVVGKIGHNHGE